MTRALSCERFEHAAHGAMAITMVVGTKPRGLIAAINRTFEHAYYLSALSSSRPSLEG